MRGNPCPNQDHFFSVFSVTSVAEKVFAERYRSGRNGVDSKSTWGPKALTWVRIPPSPPIEQRAWSIEHDVQRIRAGRYALCPMRYAFYSQRRDRGEMPELADGARLEIVCSAKSGTEGSNPSLSARKFADANFTGSF
jgi:hypothetical protein